MCFTIKTGVYLNFAFYIIWNFFNSGAGDWDPETGSWICRSSLLGEALTAPLWTATGGYGTKSGQREACSQAS